MEHFNRIYFDYTLYVEISDNPDKEVELSKEFRASLVNRIGLDVIISDLPFYVQKAQAYQNTVFPIGSDKANEICNLGYYYDSKHHLKWSLRQINDNNCEFYVFERNEKFIPPKGFEFLFTMSEFQAPSISSTELRNQ